MPPLPDVSDVLRADLLWIDGGDTDVSTRQFFRYSGGAPTSTDATALAADIYSAASAMASLWESATVLTGVRVTDLASSTGGQGIHAQSTPGTRSGGLTPGSASVLVSYLISRRYRGGKPRAYFPWGVAEDLATRQTWDSTLITSVDSDLATFYAAVIGSSSGTTDITQHVNVSYYEGFTVVTNPVTGRARNVPKLRTTPLVDTITSFAASGRVGSQRRRN